MFADKWNKPCCVTRSVALATAVGAAALCGCTESPTLPEMPGVPDPVLIDVSWQHRTPQGNDLRRLWGFSDGTFYAVGDGGTVLYFNRGTWTLMSVPSRVDLHGVWASTPEDLYVAGFDGTLLHYNGTTWTTVATPTTADLYAVWVNPPDDIFVTGMGGSVWNRFGGEWTEHKVAPDKRLRALWGYGHDEVYVCGSDETLLQFDGGAWIQTGLDLNTEGAEFRDMWGPNSERLSVLAGRALVWNAGGTWNNGLGEANGDYAHGSWGISLNNQVLVSAGLSTHLENGEVRWYETPTPEPLYDVWGLANDDYYAVGRSGNIAHFDGTGWLALSQGSVSNVRDLWMTQSGALAVGADGLVLRQNGTQWTEEFLDPGYDLYGVWDGGDVSVAVGRYSPNGRDWRPAILMNTGTSWMDAGVVGEAHRLYDVWGSADNNIYAVGWGGEILRYDGTTWSIVSSGESDASFLLSISGSSSDQIFAVGRTDDRRGLVCRFDGADWTKTTLDNVEELSAVWVDDPMNVFAVGALGAIIYYDGVIWRKMPSGTKERLAGIWGGSSTDVYAVGWRGTIIHYDGTEWTRLAPATNRNLKAIAGRSANEIFFAGDKGAILFYDGLSSDS